VTRERADVVSVGLTGGIGAGKSTALRFFFEAGALTLSADTVVHQLYLHADIKETLALQFGHEVIGADGAVDRRRLAEVVRGSREALGKLEVLTHPLVASEIKRFIADAPAGAVVVCEVPLLFETGWQSMFDLVVTVEAGPEARRGRSIHAFGLEQFGELEALQASSERRVAGADLAFFNDGHIDHLRAFVRQAYERALSLGGSARSDGAPQTVGALPQAGAASKGAA
jgi:dephospho-CoA kinase